jgi:hypothetical protein
LFAPDGFCLGLVEAAMAVGVVDAVAVVVAVAVAVVIIVIGTTI